MARGPAHERRGAIPVRVWFRTVEGTSVRRLSVPFAGSRNAAHLGRREGSGGNSSSAPKLADDRRCPEGHSRGTRGGGSALSSFAGPSRYTQQALGSPKGGLLHRGEPLSRVKGSRSQVSPVSGARSKGDLGITEQRGTIPEAPRRRKAGLALRCEKAPAWLASPIGASYLPAREARRSSHERSFSVRRERAGQPVRSRGWCASLTGETHGPGKPGRRLRGNALHVPSCERARVGCPNGRARVSHQVAEVDEQHQTATTRLALEASAWTTV